MNLLLNVFTQLSIPKEDLSCFIEQTSINEIAIKSEETPTTNQHAIDKIMLCSHPSKMA
jgi:hypothetical protein